MKIVSQNTILETLSKGGKICWDSIGARVSLLSATDEVLGTIRFDTYCRIIRYAWIEKIGSDYSREYYGKKAPGATGTVLRGDGKEVRVYIPSKEEDE